MLKHKEYNIYILGAGFSKPAKLPLGDELFELVINEVKKTTTWRGQKVNLYDNFIKPDIEKFISYKMSIEGKPLYENEVNFEEFLSYLDIEHYLGLLGGDTWSKEGNESQVLMRNYISKVIFDKQNKIAEADFKLYELFAEKLKPEDIIITFNYDTILEKVLDMKKIKYRFFPMRYDKVDEDGVTLNTTADEVIILKSMDQLIGFQSKTIVNCSKVVLDTKIIIPPTIVYLVIQRYFNQRK